MVGTARSAFFTLGSYAVKSSKNENQGLIGGAASIATESVFSAFMASNDKIPRNLLLAHNHHRRVGLGLGAGTAGHRISLDESRTCHRGFQRFAA
jgi:hypothetical protein